MDIEQPAYPSPEIAPYSPSIAPQPEVLPVRVKVEVADVVEVDSSGDEAPRPEPFEFLGTNSEVEEVIHEEFLFSPDVVEKGKVALDSSSGSDSSSSTTSESSDQDMAVELEKHTKTAFVETVPEGKDYYKHLKSKMLHSAVAGSVTFVCKRALNDKYVKMPREIRFKYPHCLGCFKKDEFRVRDVSHMADMLAENAKKRALKLADGAQKVSRTEK